VNKNELFVIGDQSGKDKFPVKMVSTNVIIRNNSNESLISNLTNPETTNNVELTLEETFMEHSLLKDNQYSDLINHSINQIEKNLSEKEEEEEEEEEEDVSLNNKSLKIRRRRHRICFYSSKRKRRKELKRISIDKFWMKKYSIEPFSIVINRYEFPLN
jgi:hypothetical protein